MYFCIVGVFCIIICYFYCMYRILYDFLYIWRYLKDMVRHLFEKCPEVWTVFVRTISLRFWGIWGVLNGPPTPTPIPGVNIKVPFRGGENMESKINVFLVTFEKRIETMVLKSLCRVAFVGWDVAKASLAKNWNLISTFSTFIIGSYISNFIVRFVRVRRPPCPEIVFERFETSQKSFSKGSKYVHIYRKLHCIS